jgi:hypothetical protein
MWHKLRLLQMYEREMLLKLKKKQQIDKASGKNKWNN